ncbi:MAG: hypothetical protein IPG07_10525 [Crocinitomicaceae bacterium]|nr:hypothetical protein [Crocinitomicaceae bacterium]
MSFSGFVSSMISSMKQNRNSLNNKKHNPFDKDSAGSVKVKKWVESVQISEEEKTTLLHQIRAERKKSQRKELLFVLIVAGIGVALFIYITGKWVI